MLLPSNYGLKFKKIWWYIHASGRKRILTSPNLNVKTNLGYVYTIEPVNAILNLYDYIILDIDALDKDLQEEVIYKRLVNLPKQDFANKIYIEKSPQGGIHILARTIQNFVVCEEKYVSGSYRVVYEIKTSCLMAPSDKYTPLCSPDTLEPIDETEWKAILDYIINQISPNIDRKCIYDMIVWNNICNTTTTTTTTTDDNVVLLENDLNSLIPKPTDSSNEDVYEFNVVDPDDQQQEQQRQPLKRRVSAQSNASSATNRQNNNKRKKVSFRDVDENPSLENELSSEKLIAYEGYKYARELSQRMSLSINKQPRNDANSNHQDECDDDDDNYLVDVNQEEPLDPTEYECIEHDNPSEELQKSKRMKLITEIFDRIKQLNPHKYSDYTKVTYVRKLRELFPKIHEMIMSRRNTMADFYGEMLKTFFETIMLTDKDLTLEAKINHGLFSSHAKYIPWYTWTTMYCNTIVILENSVTSKLVGKRSRLTTFNDYCLYRMITMLNEWGGIRLTEERARHEYNTIKERSRDYIQNAYFDPWYQFELLILKTIATVQISAQLLNTLSVYLHAMLTNNMNNLYLDILLNIRMPLGTCIDFIYEETNKGDKEKTAVVYFKNLPWIMANTANFLQYLSNQFPNCDNVRGLVRDFCEQVTTRQDRRADGKIVKFQEWSQIWPFSNGVFDYAYKTHHNNTRLQREVDYLDYIKFEHDLVESWPRDYYEKYILPEICETGEFNFSVFRNYTENDGVLNPMDLTFDYDAYIKSFYSTNLLNLYNTTRYTKEFCIYIRSLFMTEDERLGPFQLCQLFAVFTFIAHAIMRTKILQKVLNIVGTGSNGKTQFVNWLKKFFTHSVQKVTTKLFFDEKSETSQQAHNLEETFFVYDGEANTCVNITSFKESIETDSKTTRKLFHGVKRDQKALYSMLVCSNQPLHYKTKLQDSTTMDLAFDRRLWNITFYRTLGMRSKNQECSADIVDEIVTPSLCEKNNIILNKPETSQAIKRGFLYFLLDMIHVFDIGNLDPARNDYFENSTLSRRRNGMLNHPILSIIFDKIFFLDEIYLPNEIETFQTDIDLAEFLFHHLPQSYYQYCDLKSLVTNLTSWFGVNILVGEPKHDSDSMAYFEAAQQMAAVGMDSNVKINPFLNDEGRYTIKGAILRKNLSLAHNELIRRGVNIYHERVAAESVPKFKSLNDIQTKLPKYKYNIFGNIPRGQCMHLNNSTFSCQLLDVINKLLNIDNRGDVFDHENQIIPLQFPTIKKNYKNIQLKDVMGFVPKF